MIFNTHCPYEGCDGTIKVDTDKAVNKIVTAKCNKCGKECDVNLTQFEKDLEELYKQFQ